MDFGPVRYGSVKISTELSDNVKIYGSMQEDTMLFTSLRLIGFDLHTDKEINEFKEITLAFFHIRCKPRHKKHSLQINEF